MATHGRRASLCTSCVAISGATAGFSLRVSDVELVEDLCGQDDVGCFCQKNTGGLLFGGSASSMA